MGHWGERVVEVPWLLSKVKSGTALDIGSAESSYCMDLFDQGVTRLVLNDIRALHKFDPRVECEVGDIRNMQPTELFDNVLCISTLEHIALEAYGQQREVPREHSAYYPQREAFHHMMKFLKPDGQMILTLPYGKFEDFGWGLVYDAGMIAEIKYHYEVVEETYYTLVNRHRDEWQKCSAGRCPQKGMDHFNGNMRATSVCCLLLKKKQ